MAAKMLPLVVVFINIAAGILAVSLMAGFYSGDLEIKAIGSGLLAIYFYIAVILVKKEAARTGLILSVLMAGVFLLMAFHQLSSGQNYYIYKVVTGGVGALSALINTFYFLVILSRRGR